MPGRHETQLCAILDQVGHVGGVDRPFGQLSPQDVAQHERRATVADLDPAVLLELAPSLWVAAG